MTQLLDIKTFIDWLYNTKITRNIKEIHLHHTWKPDYSNWYKRPDAAYWTDSMRQFAMAERGFQDIAQHITTFPDGTLTIGRDMDLDPASIKGRNTGAICIENLGNFDEDIITGEQKSLIVDLVSVLLDHFNLDPATNVIYHTWYAPKTCPGTQFFGGNSRGAYERELLPVLISNRIK